MTVECRSRDIYPRLYYITAAMRASCGVIVIVILVGNSAANRLIGEVIQSRRSRRFQPGEGPSRGLLRD